MSIQELVDGLTLECLHNDQLLVYTFSTAQREAVDAWYDSVAGLLQGWSRSNPFLMVVDASAAMLIPTPYARQRSNDLSKLNPDITGRTALIIQDNLTGQIFRFLLSQLQRTSKAKRDRQAFTTRAEAIAWLEELLTL
ncbi:MAG: hypothetical protein H6673_16215 [Anaerolineales bacterium]|nr:hypothetical protein [Anaerolineales bacterium]